MGGIAAKNLLVAALLALLALGLAACGGGGDSSSSQSTASGGSQTATTAPSTRSGDDKGGNEKQPGDDKGGSSSDESSGDDHPSASDERSAEFRTPGGDNSIQNYGEEADGGEIEEAEEAIVGYLDARAKGEWEKSCQYLAELARKPIEQLAEKSPALKGKSCGEIIGAVSAGLPASSLKSPVVEGIASVRFKGSRGFALFHGPGGAKYFMPLVKEGGDWKVGALVASEFP